jgi:hypothetical protein
LGDGRGLDTDRVVLYNLIKVPHYHLVQSASTEMQKKIQKDAATIDLEGIPV